ncbi:MAG: zinc ribbon domain-containing protein [Chloroflexi bacterium]|nr:zinc ribbon domain-containing protein [Chloroflexota bacterium]
MPLYEYECTDCTTRFEVLRPMGQADNSIACPRCASARSRRLISVFAAISRQNGGGSRLIASSAASGGCGSCAGGACASCKH